MELEYKYKNFYQIIEANALNNPKKTVIFTSEAKFNNLELKNRIDVFARFLELPFSK